MQNCNPGVTPEVKTGKRSSAAGFLDYAEVFVFAFCAVILLFTFCFRLCSVRGPSMQDTLINGERLVVSDMFYTPERGDVIIFHETGEYYNEALVKRVIATEGETVTIDFEGGIVYVDGVALDEPYTLEPTHRRIDFGDSVTVPEGCLFVMGDNRNGSTDSRDDRIGCVDERLVIGRAFFLLVPGGDSQHGESRDWSRIGVID